MVGKHFTTELHPQLWLGHLKPHPRTPGKNACWDLQHIGQQSLIWEPLSFGDRTVSLRLTHRGSQEGVAQYGHWPSNPMRSSPSPGGSSPSTGESIGDKKPLCLVTGRGGGNPPRPLRPGPPVLRWRKLLYALQAQLPPNLHPVLSCPLTPAPSSSSASPGWLPSRETSASPGVLWSLA